MANNITTLKWRYLVTWSRSKQSTLTNLLLYYLQLSYYLLTCLLTELVAYFSKHWITCRAHTKKTYMTHKTVDKKGVVCSKTQKVYIKRVTCHANVLCTTTFLRRQCRRHVTTSATTRQRHVVDVIVSKRQHVTQRLLTKRRPLPQKSR